MESLNISYPKNTRNYVKLRYTNRKYINREYIYTSRIYKNKWKLKEF